MKEAPEPTDFKEGVDIDIVFANNEELRERLVMVPKDLSQDVNLVGAFKDDALQIAFVLNYHVVNNVIGYDKISMYYPLTESKWEEIQSYISGLLADPKFVKLERGTAPENMQTVNTKTSRN